MDCGTSVDVVKRLLVELDELLLELEGLDELEPLVDGVELLEDEYVDGVDDDGVGHQVDDVDGVGHQVDDVDGVDGDDDDDDDDVSGEDDDENIFDELAVVGIITLSVVDCSLMVDGPLVVSLSSAQHKNNV